MKHDFCYTRSGCSSFKQYVLPYSWDCIAHGFASCGKSASLSLSFAPLYCCAQPCSLREHSRLISRRSLIRSPVIPFCLDTLLFQLITQPPFSPSSSFPLSHSLSHSVAPLAAVIRSIDRRLFELLRKKGMHACRERKGKHSRLFACSCFSSVCPLLSSSSSLYFESQVPCPATYHLWSHEHVCLESRSLDTLD